MGRAELENRGFNYGELKQEFNERKSLDVLHIVFPPSELQIRNLFLPLSFGFILELMFSSSVLENSSSKRASCIDCGQQVHAGKTALSLGYQVSGQEAAVMGSYRLGK